MTAERPADVAVLTKAALMTECHEDVTRGGESQPCNKVAVAVRLDPEEGTPYPVCAYHARAVMVPLADLHNLTGVAAAHAEGYEAGRAEVTAAVEALADEWAANAVRAPTAYTSAVVREVRAALAAAPTLATVRADAGRDALLAMADEIDRGPTFPLPPSVISALIRERAAVVGDDHA